MSEPAGSGLAAQLRLRPPSRSFLGRAVRWFAGSGVGAWTLSPVLPRLDRWTRRLTGGRTTISDAVSGIPTVFLTTTGARTGQLRTAQLIAVPCGDDVAVIGSNFGRRSGPGWAANLRAEPRATVVHRGRSVPVVARELAGAEAEAVWAEGRSRYRGFATYPDMVGAHRVIPVFRLSRG